MKKLFLLAIVFSVSLVSHAQFTVDQLPYFDINVIHPNYDIMSRDRLTMQGGWFGPNADYTRAVFSSNIHWDANNHLWKNTSDDPYRDFGMIRFENDSQIGFYVSSYQGQTSTPVEMTNADMEQNRVMIMTKEKRVGIGTSNPDSKLTVDGQIHCTEVKVTSSVSSPDYVFEKYYTGDSELNKDYVMPTLEEVEAYTKENHHLPEIPSAQEIKDNGLKLKEMTNLLLQKIEELTLYTIEQEKRIKALEAKLAVADAGTNNQ